MQYSAVQSSALHSSAIQCIVIKQGTLLSIALHCSAVQYSGLQCSVNTLQLYFTITMPAAELPAGRQQGSVLHDTVQRCIVNIVLYSNALYRLLVEWIVQLTIVL